MNVLNEGPTVDFHSLTMNALSKVTRPGIEPLKKFIQESDFFMAPASTKYHGSFSGGLAKHSWDVYKLLCEKAVRFNLEVSDETLVICGLLHDACKINLYVMAKKNVKENGKWIERDVWEQNDTFPMGHGEKSVYNIRRFIELSDEESLAIRWHMGFSEPKELWWTLNAAFDKCPILTALYTADMEASHIIERSKPQL